jgi:hypothetical protein
MDGWMDGRKDGLGTGYRDEDHRHVMAWHVQNRVREGRKAGVGAQRN